MRKELLFFVFILISFPNDALFAQVVLPLPKNGNTYGIQTDEPEALINYLNDMKNNKNSLALC